MDKQIANIFTAGGLSWCWKIHVNLLNVYLDSIEIIAAKLGT